MDKKDMMADDQQGQKSTQSARDEQAAKKRQVRFVEEGVKTQYAGIFNIGFGADAVVFMYGNPSLDPNVVKIESKVAVSLKTAKRMAVMLGNMIRRYEKENGAIDISVPKAASDEAPKLQ
ncbi:MAG: hypothetical protein M0009_06790 [Deltaproteobacteria bacterium]|nr:hypothetical protein [Deltaproteobacteria bacterium]